MNKSLDTDTSKLPPVAPSTQADASTQAVPQTNNHDEPAGSPSTPAPPQQAHPHSPAIADDSDLIEKAWVEKAKHIVDSGVADPYALSEELAKMKQDYMMKRYGKSSQGSGS